MTQEKAIQEAKEKLEKFFREIVPNITEHITAKSLFFEALQDLDNAIASSSSEKGDGEELTQEKFLEIIQDGDDPDDIAEQCFQLACKRLRAVTHQSSKQFSLNDMKEAFNLGYKRPIKHYPDDPDAFDSLISKLAPKEHSEEDGGDNFEALSAGI